LLLVEPGVITMSIEVQDPSADELSAAVVKLSPDERLRVMDAIVASLGHEAEMDAAWDRLAEERELAFAQGRLSLLDGPAAMASLRAHWAQP
jgi:hypothetical protein